MKKIFKGIVLTGCLILAGHIYSQSPSDSCLIPRAIYTEPLTYKLTKGYTTNNWGTQLFVNGRASVMQYVTTNPYDTLISVATFHMDHAWNRMIYQEYPKSWIRAYGSQGSDTAQFLWARSLDAQSFCVPGIYGRFYRIYIADSHNRRIGVLKYSFGSENMTYDHAITSEYLHYPIDVSINNAGTFLWYYDDHIWVLDRWQIKRFDWMGNFRVAYGTHGCDGSVGKFCNPTAVSCGRSYIPEDPEADPNSNNRYIYVADPGNDRIVWLEKDLYSEYIYWKGCVATPGSFIVDLAVDNFGQVWAADRENNCLMKYTYDLFPLCTYGASTATKGQLFWPLHISNPGGYWGCGNLMVTESWSDTSGVQYFDIGTELIDVSVEHSNNQHWHYISYVLVDPSKVTVKIYDLLGRLVKTLREGPETSGPSFYVWDGSNNADSMVASGIYRIGIYDTSLYWNLETQLPGTYAHYNSGFFNHTLNPYTHYIPGDVNNDGAINIADAVYFINYIFKDGPAPQPYLCIGDVNTDQFANVGDVVYLINHIFKGGPAPDDGCQTWPE